MNRAFGFTSILIILFILLIISLPAADRLTGRQFTTRSEVIGAHGMAATSQPLATGVALDILKKGGSAIDAAIAANASLGLMEPTGNGLGGDLFAIVWIDSEQKLYGLNASGRSPKGLTLEEFQNRGLEMIPSRGALPVSVPGVVDGWFELHNRFGKLPINEVLAPAIKYCREGFPVSQVIAYYWNASEFLGENPNFAKTFLPGGRAPKAGEIFKNPDLGDTLEKIARGGRDAYYKGNIARTIDEYCKKAGCFLRYEDLASHTSTWVEPESTNYRGYDVWELPPNGQGIAALQMLNILEAYNLKEMGHNSADYLHHLVEAKKLAFADRAKFYSDPAFNDLPIKELISKEYADERRKLLDPLRALRNVPAGNPRLQNGDTIYLTVADKDHNMVSLIQSNYMGFGSGLVPDGLGFGLQNRGALFTLEEGHFNQYEPGKRPFHTIIPAFITKDGKPFISFGLMGGGMQPQGHVQIVCNLIDFGMSLQEAGDAPRWRHSGSPEPTGAKELPNGGTLFLESGISTTDKLNLVKKGHRIGFTSGGFGGYQSIMYDAENNVYYGASESRKDGHAAGY
jgi:gamma-glutamyltranspeptidase / glutathione hydrolase